MKLTMKHSAIFGRVIVNLQGINSSFYKYTDLYTLYKGGWFITERFGNTLCMCKRKTNGEWEILDTDSAYLKSLLGE